MKVYGLNPTDVSDGIGRVSREAYDANVCIRDIRDHSTRRQDRTSVTMTVCDTRGFGARTSTRPGSGHNGRRRIKAACWHVHYDVIAQWFAQGATRVVTAFADYRPADFHTQALATAETNAGNAWEHVSLSDLCPCEEADWSPWQGRPTPVTAAPSDCAGWPVTVDTREYAHSPSNDAASLAWADAYTPRALSPEPGGDAMRPNVAAGYFLDHLDTVLADEA